MPPNLPVPTRCRFCLAEIRWALHVERYKKVPLEVTPDPGGSWVVTQDEVLGLLAVPFEAAKHGSQKRYRSHLERCRPQRRDGQAAPAPKPDATAGLAFPRGGGLVRGPLPMGECEGFDPKTGCPGHVTPEAADAP